MIGKTAAHAEGNTLTEDIIEDSGVTEHDASDKLFLEHVALVERMNEISYQTIRDFLFPAHIHCGHKMLECIT